MGPLQLNLATRSQVRNLGDGENKHARSRPARKAMKGRNQLDASRHIQTATATPRARRDKQLKKLVLRSRTTKLRFPHPVGPIGFPIDTGHANCPS